MSLSAAGGDFGGFELEVTAVPPLHTDLSGFMEIDAGPFVASWTPADPGSRVRLILNADTAAHGLIHPAVIECDVADSAGEITVLASLMEIFVEPDNWGCGDCAGSELYRYRRSRASVSVVDVVFDARSWTNFVVVASDV